MGPHAAPPVPYYSRDGLTLYHGDCREILPRLGLQADCIVTDEPYGVTSLAWDRRLRWSALAHGSLKPDGTLWRFGSQRMLLETAPEWSDWLFVQDVVWEKNNGSSLLNDRFRRVHEHALQFRKKGSKWRDVFKNPQRTEKASKPYAAKKRRPAHFRRTPGIVRPAAGEKRGPARFRRAPGIVRPAAGERFQLQRSVIFARSCRGFATHPTQKPTEVVRPLVSYSCPPGGLVLDPFAGSGTTLAVCRDLGIRCVAVESDEAYCQAIVRRLGAMDGTPRACADPLPGERGMDGLVSPTLGLGLEGAA